MKLETKILFTFIFVQFLLVSLEVLFTEACIALGAQEGNRATLFLMAQYGRPVQYLIYFAFNGFFTVLCLSLYKFFDKVFAVEFSGFKHKQTLPLLFTAPILLVIDGILLSNTLNNLTVLLQVI